MATEFAPWRAEDGATDYYNCPEGAPDAIGIYGGEQDFCIALVVTDVFTPEQIQAHANLIAAAPELYEAAEIGLVALVEERAALAESHCLLRDGKPDEATLEEDVKPEIARLDKAIALVNAALSRARGEA